MFAELKATGRSEEELLAILASKSRDNGRTPMQWDASANAGFTTGTPWITPSENFATINSEQALADNDSVFYTYQHLISLRKELLVLTHGDYQDLLPDNPNLWCYRRTWNDQQLTVIANLTAEQQILNLDHATQAPLFSNYADEPIANCLRPYECLYLLSAADRK